MFATVTEASLYRLDEIRARVVPSGQPRDTGRRLPTGEVVAFNPGTGHEAVVDPSAPVLWGEGVYAQVRRDRLTRHAPDLLDALRLFAGENSTHTDRERLDAARAAVARAEGRS